jgi:undecaprenyl-diphosphatase
MLELLQNIDEKLFFAINGAWTNSFFDSFFPTITNGVYWIVPGILVGGWFLFREKKKGVYILMMAILTVSLTDSLTVRVIKPLVARERPCDPDRAVNGGRFLIGQKNSFSFPSAHAANVFGQAMLFGFFYVRYAWLFFSVACLIGYSRIYVGVHYPLDVAGGACLGIIVAIIFSYLMRKLFKNSILNK